MARKILKNVIDMQEIDIEERLPEMTLDPDTNYVLIITYLVIKNKSAVIASKAMRPDELLDKLDEIINDIEQKRMVRIHNRYINPDNIVSVIVDQEKSKEELEEQKMDRLTHTLKKQATQSAMARIQSQTVYNELMKTQKEESEDNE